MRILVALMLMLTGCADVSREHDLLREQLELSFGMSIADIGAGSGEFTAWLAGEVGSSGRVFATELGDATVADLQARFAQMENIDVRAAAVSATGLPDACCNAVLMRNVYHHLTDPTSVLGDIRRALKPGGTLFIIDFEPTWLLSPWTPEDLPDDRSGHGVTPDQVVTEAHAAGFDLVATMPWPSRHFVEHYAVKLRHSG